MDKVIKNLLQWIHLKFCVYVWLTTCKLNSQI